MDHTNIVGLVELTDQTAGDKTPSASTTNAQPPPADWASTLHMDHLPSAARARVIDTLTSFESMWTGTLGEMKTPPHRFEQSPGAQPVFQPPYQAGKAGQEIEQREVERMLKAGVIEPATSEWASPVVLITKKDGETRFFVDYRRLNAVTKKDSYPLPRMDECLDSLGEAGIFTTLDCNSGYWQITVAPEDRDKIPFVSHEGLHRNIRMLFGLVNAPATFQRSIDLMSISVKWKQALIYLDDVIIFSPTLDEHYGHVSQVLHLLHQAGVSLKMSKCHFFQPSVEYLGHVVHPGKLAVPNKKSDATVKAERPRNRTELD
jgi:hypothetical protein